MRFWDTSAIVPLCLSEPATPVVRRIAVGDTALVVYWATRTECVSAFARRRREGQLAASAERQARRVLLALAAEWSEVLPADPVRERAERLLGVHPLRAADAFQLAAALVWSRDETRACTIVSFDERLRAAAEREGFSVLPEFPTARASSRG
ncbi:MAG: type II toxin-antitoxin system VapC family toxin [Myxococcota bacterium]